MLLREDWHLLREVEVRVTSLSSERNDILNDARFLIVGLLDQERIVLDALGENWVTFLRHPSGLRQQNK